MSAVDPTENEVAIERAADILESEPAPVVRGIFQLLIAGRGQTPLQDGSTHTALKILNAHIENEHHAKCLKMEAEERTAAARQKPLLFALGIIGVSIVSFLFLKYNHPEFIVAVFTAAAGFAAGYGTAGQRSKKN